MPYLHHVEGRLRVRSERAKRADTACEVRRFLTGIEGVDRVETRTVTGSITIWYDPCRTSGDMLLVALHQAGHLAAEPVPALPDVAGGAASRPMHRDAMGACHSVALEALFQHVLGKVVERMAVAAVRALV